MMHQDNFTLGKKVFPHPPKQVTEGLCNFNYHFPTVATALSLLKASQAILSPTLLIKEAARQTAYGFINSNSIR